ncbi:hypothetical protein CKL83_04655 [Bacillus anthracis]|nr:hypothetical protein BVB96_20770 [Bacillus anthracis]AQM47888.1 hypothetical protein BZG08_20970 [Bacillus anthracis]ASE28876.1 hypothetical protein CEQ19_07455 [Bacillus anthracis]AWU54755.1 hypothetical protein DNQ11_20820 [Bacillus anthracis]MCG3106074.1 hypothetical protein [Bacillus anthracis]
MAINSWRKSLKKCIVNQIKEQLTKANCSPEKRLEGSSELKCIYSMDGILSFIQGRKKCCE